MHSLSSADYRIKLILISGAILIASALILKYIFEPSQRCNIVLISIDALNRSALDAYNHEAPELPVLGALADYASVFENAYSTASWTLPAHGSIFTGCYPDRHGGNRPEQRISGSLPNLAEILRNQNYFTVGFTDKGYVSSSFGFNRGFYIYDDWADTLSKADLSKIPRNGEKNLQSGANLFDRGASFIKSWNEADGNFFLFLHTYIVHDYFMQYQWTVNNSNPVQDISSEYCLECLLGIKKCSGSEWDFLKKLYQTEVLRMDQGLGKLFETLIDKDLWDSTLIIFLSDHGEGFQPDIDRIHHGGRLHEDLIKIPFMISGPGIEPARLYTPVSLVDILPTILDLTGIQVPQNIDGQSLKDVITEEDDSDLRPLYAMEFFHMWKNGRRLNVDNSGNGWLSAAVIWDNYWYNQNFHHDELYNMAKDPFQLNDLSSEATNLREFNALVNQRKEFKSIPLSSHPDKAIQDQLRSLGYIK